jgi:hypothetical protein
LVAGYAVKYARVVTLCHSSSETRRTREHRDAGIPSVSMVFRVTGLVG